MKKADSSFITGSDGFLGSALKEYLISRKERVTESTRRKDTCTSSRIFLDLSADIDDDWSPPAGVSIVYLCAAMTSLEKCYRDPVRSAKINVYNTVKIAKKCIENDAFVIFPSTNLVFDGSVPYRKIHEPVSPKTEYSRQKADAEKKLLELGERIAIVRFTKIIDPRMTLIRGWQGALRSNQKIHPFSNYVMAPVPVFLAVETLHSIASGKMQGIHHVSGPDDITYSDIAFHLADRLQVNHDFVVPVPIENSGTFIEHNPKYTTLDTKETAKKTGIKIPDVLSSLDLVFFHD